MFLFLLLLTLTTHSDFIIKRLKDKTPHTNKLTEVDLESSSESLSEEEKESDPEFINPVHITVEGGSRERTINVAVSYNKNYPSNDDNEEQIFSPKRGRSSRSDVQVPQNQED